MNKKCLQCGVEFETTILKKLYCSGKCASNANYLRNRDKVLSRAKTYRLENPEKIKERNQKRDRRRKAATLIRQVAFDEPTYGAKMLWDGHGSWSRKYGHCEQCHKTLYKHKAGGLCMLCYAKLIYRQTNTVEKAQRNRERVYEWAKQNRSRTRKYEREKVEIINKLESGEIKVTSTIQNILNNYDLLDDIQINKTLK